MPRYLIFLFSSSLNFKIIGLFDLILISSNKFILAFKEMAKDAKNGIPTRSMLTFIAINCSSLTLIPTTIISLRQLNNGITSFSLILIMILYF